jgi:phosphoribosylformylglycinamidine cyclo-ligase
MSFIIEEYEKREEKAIRTGKKILGKAEWLINRKNDWSKGFFFELIENNYVYPNHCEIHCVDGVGTKLFLSSWSENYSLFPIDAIAMNANDMATAIHALPNCVDLYFAVAGEIEDKYMGDIIQGFVNGLEKIKIPNALYDVNIGKIETASLDEIVSLGEKGKGLDVGVVMTGFIERIKVPNLNPKEGNYIVGVSSSGLHSNGYTRARHVLFSEEVEYREEWKSQYKGRLKFDDKPSILEGKTVIEALGEPTSLYLVEAALIGEKFDCRDIYGVNITGNGLHNFNRAGRKVSFEITDPLNMLGIHRLLIDESKLSPKEAYRDQNMGMGFSYIVPNLKTAEGIKDFINSRGYHSAKIVGEVKASDENQLRTTIHKPYEGEKIDFIGYNN